MPYTLSLTIPPTQTKAQMIANSTALNSEFLFNYDWQFIEQELGNKESAEQTHTEGDKKGLSKLSIFPVDKQRRICLFFASIEAAETFMKVEEGLTLPFYSYTHENLSIVGITVSTLKLCTVKLLKSVFLNYFKLPEQIINEILSIAAPVFNDILKDRTDIEANFKEKLTQLYSTSTQPLSPDFIAKIDLLSQRLIQKAQAFDNDEKLQQRSATFALGNLFLSFNLQFLAIKLFNSILPTYDDYCAAQLQLASLYLSPQPIHDSLHPESLSLEPSNQRIENAFMAALNAKAPELAATSANLLCGLEEDNAYYSSADFQFCETIRVHPINCWLKIFAQIAEQQKRIKALESQNNGTPVLTGFQNLHSGSTEALTKQVQQLKTAQGL